MPDRHSEKTKVICKCPKCERKYKKAIFWTGKGIPRILCESCRESDRTFGIYKYFEKDEKENECLSTGI